MQYPRAALVFLDNVPVGPLADSAPRVATIVAAAGRRSDGVQVLQVRFPGDVAGRPVAMEDTIDRTAQPTTPIHLTIVSRPPAPSAAPWR